MSIQHVSVLIACLLISGCVTPTATTPVASPPPALAAEPELARDPAPEPQPIEHAGVGAAVRVSSTQREYPDEGPAEALVDGNLSTRWSSLYEAPQQIDVSLSEALPLAFVRLHWEAASAQYYTVSVTVDGETWTEAAVIVTDDVGPRVDAVDLGGQTVLALRFDLRERVNPEWGFSLFEIELVAAE